LSEGTVKEQDFRQSIHDSKFMQEKYFGQYARQLVTIIESLIQEG